uniref:Uncharacterized protein n=1 Tax=Rhizophagus irregularis (strain DAOM 181602 / DAOM 197198 / MUCL 43194) TaxID=747089 RepID=U9TC22_RHIID
MLCYADVVKVIRDVKDDNLSISNSFNKITDIERRTFKKVLTYNLSLYFTIDFQLIGSPCYHSGNFGGIESVIQYLYNEGLSDDKTSNGVTTRDGNSYGHNWS